MDHPANSPGVVIETHGCKLNMADSQAIAREFAEAGFDVGGRGEPDVYVLNSCTVTHVADRKARRALAAARRAHPGALIVAAGCMAERSPAAAEALDAVDVVVTNRDRAQLVCRVAARLGVPAPARSPGPWRLPWAHMPAAHVPRGVSREAPTTAAPLSRALLGRTRAFIKIQEGCDQVCAYCIVPRVRGRERSIPVAELVARVRDAHDSGLNEVVLTGTQLGTYGFDLAGATLPSLLKRLLDDTAIPRIRVSSLQPPEMTDALLALWSGPGRGRLCPHFHMPLQSGSDRVLARMRRRYTASEYLRAVRIAQSVAPGAAVTADVIAGFPGETVADFEATAQVLADASLAGAHVFPYSARPGTSAARFPDQVAPEMRSRRAARLREIADASALEFRRALVGQVRPVLWETGGAMASGLSDNYVRVYLRPDTAGERGAPSRVNRIERVALVGVSGDRMRADALQTRREAPRRAPPFAEREM